MGTKRVLEILPGVPLYIFIANLLAKPSFPPNHAIVALTTIAPPHVTRAWSDESITLVGRNLDEIAQANRESMETSDVSPST